MSALRSCTFLRTAYQCVRGESSGQVSARRCGDAHAVQKTSVSLQLLQTARDRLGKSIGFCSWSKVQYRSFSLSSHRLRTTHPASKRTTWAIGVPQNSHAVPSLVTFHRDLAKKTGKGKKGKKGAAKGSDDDGDDDEDDIEKAAELDLDKMRQSMQKALDHMQREFSSMQVGRATPNMLDAIQVTQRDGGLVPLSAVAKVLAPSANTLQVSVFDSSMTQAVLTAIEKSELQLNPEIQGKTVKVTIPRATAETRAQVAKQVKQLAEHCKTVMRRARQDGMKQAKALPSKDDMRRAEKEVQDILDTFTKKADSAAEAKEKEVSHL
uniref:Ribosome recycling factor domain-containing protein n=1 Tax=Chrysotila carterae TaxID=13221 RepID=A0A7S4ETR0_CHRCT